MPPKNGPVGSLRAVDARSIVAELRRRRAALERARRRLADELAEVEAAIGGIDSALAGSAVPRRSQRLGHGRPGSLGATLESILHRRGPMGVVDLAKEVLRAGYATRAKDFRGRVNEVLKTEDRFVRVWRGVYGLREHEASSGPGNRAGTIP